MTHSCRKYLLELYHQISEDKSMNYEIVELEQKLVVGKCIVTSNSDPKMGEEIGKLWEKLYDSKCGYYCEIKNRINESAIGLYSDYQQDKYTVTVGAEVSKAENSEFTAKTIIKGKYAKFAVHGNMITAVAKAWGEIWKIKLDRTFAGDFEEYLPCDGCKNKESCNVQICTNCDINIYVAIK